MIVSNSNQKVIRIAGQLDRANATFLGAGPTGALGQQVFAAQQRLKQLAVIVGVENALGQM